VQRSTVRERRAARATRRSFPARLWSGLDEALRPHEPIAGRTYLGGVGTSVLLLVGVWVGLTYGGLVQPLFLPSPSDIARAALALARDGSLLVHTQASLVVIMSGWALAAVVAVPLGTSRVGAGLAGRRAGHRSRC
jgi:hypothetical protein